MVVLNSHWGCSDLYLDVSERSCSTHDSWAAPDVNTVKQNCDCWGKTNGCSGNFINVRISSKKACRSVSVHRRTTDTTRLDWPALLESCLLGIQLDALLDPRWLSYKPLNLEALVFPRDETSSAPRFNTSSETTALGEPLHLVDSTKLICWKAALPGSEALQTYGW